MGSLFFFSLGASAKQLRWNELYVGQTESGSSSSAQWLQILWRVSGACWLVETGADVSLDVALTINSPSPEWVLALFMCAWEICPFKKKATAPESCFSNGLKLCLFFLLNYSFPSSICLYCSVSRHCWLSSDIYFCLLFYSSWVRFAWICLVVLFSLDVRVVLLEIKFLT